MLVPNTLLQFSNQELLSPVGTFVSYNIGCWVLQPDVSPPREGCFPLQAHALSGLCIWRSAWQGLASLAGSFPVLLCTVWTLRQMGWPGGPSGFWQQLCQCWHGRASQQPSDALHSLVQLHLQHSQTVWSLLEFVFSGFAYLIRTDECKYIFKS